MPLCKICPACKMENKPECIICNNCMTDISSLSPVDTSLLSQEKEAISVEECLEDKKGKSHVIIEFEKRNEEIRIYNGDIIGRHCKCKEVLEQYKTVSRKHLLFLMEDNKWYIQDLRSSNHTYLNGEKMIPGNKYKIEKGDEISLCMDINFKIKDIIIISRRE